jgi:hypothetical protein
MARMCSTPSFLRLVIGLSVSDCGYGKALSVNTKHSGRFVAYYRVSTARQGRSGLGLEAQRQAVGEHLNGGNWKLIGEYTEVERVRQMCRRLRPARIESVCVRQEETGLGAGVLNQPARGVAWLANRLAR